MTRDKTFTFVVTEDDFTGDDSYEYRENVPYFYIEDGEDPSIYTRLLNGEKTYGKVVDGKFVPLDQIPEKDA